MPEVEPQEMVPVYQNIRHCLGKPLLKKEDQEVMVSTTTSFCTLAINKKFFQSAVKLVYNFFLGLKILGLFLRLCATTTIFAT